MEVIEFLNRNILNLPASVAGEIFVFVLILQLVRRTFVQKHTSRVFL